MTDDPDLDNSAGADGDADGDTEPDIHVSEDEAAVIEMLGEDAAEQKKNVAIAQAELIGDL